MKPKIGYELKGGCRELEDLKGKEYDYLGHFRKKEFQREGHNFMTKKQRTSEILAGVSSGMANVSKAFFGMAERGVSGGKAKAESVGEVNPLGGDESVEPFFEKEAEPAVSPAKEAEDRQGRLEGMAWGRRR